MGERISIYEVGLRDGLQNERTAVSTPDKVHLLEGLASAGLRRLEVTSFVNPNAVPQMADAPDVVAAAARHAELRPTALVINEKGYDRARAAGVRSIAMVVVITETLAQRNSRMSVADGLATCRRVLERARQDGVDRRVYLAPAFVCPFEGAVAPDHVARCADAIGAGEDTFEIAIADTIGHAHPLEVGRLFETFASRFGAARLAAHLHDTQGLALANAAAAISAGVRTIDASVGGLGGCPFAPGAAGNLATEDLVLMVQKMGFETGVDLAALHRVVSDAERIIGRPLGGRSRAWWKRTEEEHAKR